MNCDCDCDEIKELSSIKHLGLIYDNNLNWKYHIEHLTKLVRTFFNIFKTLRLFLDTKVLRIVYYSLVNSIISYGISIWGSTLVVPSKLILLYIILL